jgi:hypothetical protein
MVGMSSCRLVPAATAESKIEIESMVVQRLLMANELLHTEVMMEGATRKYD